MIHVISASPILSTLDGWVVNETKTKYTVCGFEDYWAYGYFESDRTWKVVVLSIIR